MFADGLFLHRLYAETACYLLQHPGVRHWQAVVLTPRAGLPLGPVELFAEFLERRVTIVSLEDLSRRQALEPLEELLTLVVRQEPELPGNTRAGAGEPECRFRTSSLRQDHGARARTLPPLEPCEARSPRSGERCPG